ncbi:sodium/glutamate symporter [Aliagarivorans marinus]|uniref:sodium/glutamate symporter n=1 Tax=Aliagarivorans marinus TaxID=561965 RepID=UPI00041800F4|nr:sodium/glutamate symporter [Aliagarivorans marinus]
MPNSYTFSELESFLVAIAVLFLGRFIASKVSLLERYNIPEPIIGGLVVAFAVVLMRQFGIEVNFQLPLQDTLMLMFFSTVGLAANYKLLAKGGAKVFIFLGVATLFIVVQNAIGVSMASALGLEPLLGLIAGSISLSGGHGTGAAWAQTFAEDYDLQTLEFAMAAATFGLVMGGIIGGPVGQRLVRRRELNSDYGNDHRHHEQYPDLVTFDRKEEERVTATSLSETLFVMLFCVAGAKLVGEAINQLQISALRMPDFVYGLFIGVFIANALELSGKYKLHSESLDAMGTLSLSLFLSMALMSLRLWEIFDLALPLLLILFVQTITLMVFAYIVTFRFMGSNYDAAIISGGHCGFGLGATPTAVMNMSALVARNGPSPQAFMVVPIVGAFFIDIVNLIVLQFYIGWLT